MSDFTDIVAQVIRDRRTIHSFKPERPDAAVIRNAIDLARWAPNHRHTEPWRFHLLGDLAKQKVVELNARLVAEKKGPAAGDAKRERWSEIPGWLAVTCSRSDDNVQDIEDYAATCCAIHNFSLYLWSLNIGVKWTTGAVTRHEEFFNLLGLSSANHRCVGLLWYGYPAVIPSQTRNPLEAILIELD